MKNFNHQDYEDLIIAVTLRKESAADNNDSAEIRKWEVLLVKLAAKMKTTFATGTTVRKGKVA